MHKDYEVYKSTVAAAFVTRRAADTVANEQHRADPNYALVNARHSMNSAVEQIAVAEARVALKASADPLVAFIAGRPLDDYPTHADTIMEALPATMEELEAIARAGDWCAEWSKFVDLASEAGVLPGQPTMSTETAAVRKYIRENWGPRRERMVEFGKLLDTAVAAAKAEGYKAAQDECEAARTADMEAAIKAVAADTEVPDHEAPAE